MKVEVRQLSFKNEFGENEISNVIKYFCNYKISGTMGLKSNFRIGIKQLLFVLKMIKSQGSGNFENDFIDSLRITGYDQ